MVEVFRLTFSLGFFGGSRVDTARGLMAKDTPCLFLRLSFLAGSHGSPYMGHPPMALNHKTLVAEVRALDPLVGLRIRGLGSARPKTRRVAQGIPTAGHVRKYGFLHTFKWDHHKTFRIVPGSACSLPPIPATSYTLSPEW